MNQKVEIIISKNGDVQAKDSNLPLNRHIPHELKVHDDMVIKTG